MFYTPGLGQLKKRPTQLNCPDVPVLFGVTSVSIWAIAERPRCPGHYMQSGGMFWGHRMVVAFGHCLGDFLCIAFTETNIFAGSPCRYLLFVEAKSLPEVSVSFHD